MKTHLIYIFSHTLDLELLCGTDLDAVRVKTINAFIMVLKSFLCSFRSLITEFKEKKISFKINQNFMEKTTEKRRRFVCQDFVILFFHIFISFIFEFDLEIE